MLDHRDYVPGRERYSGSMRKDLLEAFPHSHAESHERQIRRMKARGIPVEPYLPRVGKKTNVVKS